MKLYDKLFRKDSSLRKAMTRRFETAPAKGTGRMAEQLQAVYIIPASDGCRVATAHFSCEAAEGFGRRFSYMLNTLALMDR